MADGCATEGCTVASTGICVLANDPSSCEFREVEQNQESKASLEDVVPALSPLANKPTLWGSLPLDIDDVRNMMAQDQCLLVGVLGTPAAGKTAALVSFYLLLAHGKLEGFSFADSKSLMAFEEISQGARRWSESPPEEMTVRTETSGGRVAGFLHVKVKRASDSKFVSLIVPDLPGEWSDALIDSNKTDRFAFLKSADVVWLFVSGSDLRTETERMHTLSRTKLLLQRLSNMFAGTNKPIKFVVTYADKGRLAKATSEKLEKMANDVGLLAEVMPIASFSKTANVAPGFGIARLIEASIPSSTSITAIIPEEGPSEDRYMLRYRSADRT